MPEGNEIHRWAERHTAAFAGRPVRADGPQGRFTDAAVIHGRKLARVMAVGKHLGYDFGKDRILHVHLGLQGDFTEGSGPLPEVRGALRLRMWNAQAVKRAAEPGVSKRHGWYSQDDGTGHLGSGEDCVGRVAGADGLLGVHAGDVGEAAEAARPRSSEWRWAGEGDCEDSEEQEADWRFADGPGGGGRDWEYLSGGAVVSSEAESVYSGQ